MKAIPVILIFDVGKTNKKLLLFDEQYKVVYEESKQFPETNDEDGFAGEDVHALTQWIKHSFNAITNDARFDVRAVNFSAYGASFVYLDKDLQAFLPLYNYLKPYSPELQQKFYNTYGGESLIAKQTASPVLGNLNSGMQLYRLKYEKPEAFALIKYALHLPQYLSFILSSKLHSDITSIGCHTNLWNFQNNKYHRWVKQEAIQPKLAPVLDCEAIAGNANETIPVGVGLHDSSSALIPYFASFQEPFVLLSTGTWCISMNPFNHTQLSDHELHQDCLCYLSYKGKPVKASRLFAGYEHEQQTKRLAAHFNKPLNYFTTVLYSAEILNKLQPGTSVKTNAGNGGMIKQSNFNEIDLNGFANYEEAYHRFIRGIIEQQVKSTTLVLNETGVRRIFVDGGFSNNEIYMHLLAEAFKGIEVYAATVAQASALGAALVMHQHWNSKPLPTDIIELKLYSATHNPVL